MAKSALLKSSIVKKYWMALTGLFLCLFLAGHLAGNLQLIFGDALQFNQYAVFMTSNPAVKLLSYLTYFSILFHAFDGFMLTYQNVKARPIGYAKTNPGANSSFSSRNMAVLGTLILVFIVTHMVNFWAVMHFDKNMPLMKQTVEVQGQKQELFVGRKVGEFYQVDQIQLEGEAPNPMMPKQITIKNGTDVYNIQANVKIGELYKDLHKITFAFFQDAKTGLIATILYVLAMAVLAFHLLHGFQSAFQSLGVNNKFTPAIKTFGKLFAIIVPLLFAVIPVYIHFFK
ncbi:succinate dehydrogenase cytochrome B subunit [Flavobacterium cauense R2A-7]|uniref:Succinate dehydrogenase / fumarate reductase cytochrome b subunit n=1 Tax=Flavobacterium cauense R2A-7 TaxID=1341154 RepID=V6S609_9FLAO|nr:succinate dehydrogenase cytochrome b subunit [Flavobacterium cauense]ESU21854.1 succinate dehydrogenase cytochrome B subunit [Flavobacterium cauense R2A-7]KGO81084.1 succinate dehydrogenase [Flavobacterium cauense R2A-7]TWI13000.1 succinate dehydrogenase / fumarate reductase cytochrome b subunit [Flavobacterium cauense R2A-7]